MPNCPTLTIKGPILARVRAAATTSSSRQVRTLAAEPRAGASAAGRTQEAGPPRREALLGDPGPGRLSAEQQKVFKDTGPPDEAGGAGALTIGGSCSTAGPLTRPAARRVGLRAEHLAIDDIRQGRLGVHASRGRTSSRSRHQAAALPVSMDWQHKPAELGTKGESVESLRIEQQDIGLSVDHRRPDGH